MNAFSLLSRILGSVLLWSIVTINLVLPKSELRYWSWAEYQLIFINIFCTCGILCVLVYKVTRDVYYVFNYSALYWLFIVLLLPHYGITQSTFAFLWLLAATGYVLQGAIYDCLPFIVFPAGAEKRDEIK
jgi:hypothetical protein